MSLKDFAGKNQKSGMRGGSKRARGSQRLRDARLVFDSIRRIVRVLRVTARHTEKSVGLSAAQLFVLQKLAEAPALTPSELAARTLTDQSSISVVATRLVEKGYITRSRSMLDARSYELGLTPAGRAALKKSPDATQERLLNAMLAMPAGDVRKLATLMHRLVERTGIAEERPTMMMEEDGPRGG